MTNDEIIQQAAEMLRQQTLADGAGQAWTFTWHDDPAPPLGVVDYCQRPDGVWEMAQE